MRYSQDMKDLAVRKVLMGKTHAEISKELLIPSQSIRNWHMRFIAVGHCRNKKSPGTKPRVTEEAFNAFIEAHPNSRQSDVATHFGTSRTGIQ
jgi:transposase-like protein